MAFEEWSEKKKTLVTAIVGGVVVLATWSVFAWRYKKLAVAREEQKAQKQIEEEKKKEVDKANRKKLEEKQFDISQEFEKKKTLIPPEKDVDVFLTEDLVGLIRESALSQHEFKIIEGKVTDANISAGRGQITPIKKQEFSLVANGTYHDALTFLNTIEEHFPRIVNVDKIDMNVNTKLTSGDRTMLNLVFKFYIFFEKGGQTAQPRKRRKKK